MSQPQENESLAGVMRNPSKVALLRVSSAALNNESIIEILDDLDTLIMNQHITVACPFCFFYHRTWWDQERWMTI